MFSSIGFSITFSSTGFSTGALLHPANVATANRATIHNVVFFIILNK
jgi:hypothetical protein